MRGVMLAMIIFVLDLFKFPRFPTLLLFLLLFLRCLSISAVHIPYSPSSCYTIYNKEAVSHTLSSLSTSASHVAVTGADTALYNFEIVFLKNVRIPYYMFLEKFLSNFMEKKKRLRGISLSHYFPS